VAAVVIAAGLVAGLLLALRGSRKAKLAPSTVVIQHTTVRTSRFLEYGKPPPYAQSTRSGTALVLRGGKAGTTHWSRLSAHGGTTFTTLAPPAVLSQLSTS
jgi:hypothetical protein